jgi:hypothetical protein
MKIDLDQYYLVRAGHKAKCVHRSDRDRWLFIYLDGPYKEECFMTTNEGNYNFGENPLESPYDVVSSYVPPRELFVSFANDGSFHVTSSRTHKDQVRFVESLAHGG